MRHRAKVCIGMIGLLALILGQECVAPPPVPPPGGGGDATRGATLYTGDTCVSCHGSKACGRTGPNIQDATLETMVTFLRGPANVHLGETRPNLSDQDLADLVAYVNSQSSNECVQIQLVVASPPSLYADFSLVSTHNPASDDYDLDCVSCHGSLLDKSGTDGTTLAAHSTMPGLLGSGSHRCLNCHVDSGDLVAQESARLRQDVFSGVASCGSAKCHGASGPVPFYAVDK